MLGLSLLHWIIIGGGSVAALLLLVVAWQCCRGASPPAGAAKPAPASVGRQEENEKDGAAARRGSEGRIQMDAAAAAVGSGTLGPQWASGDCTSSKADDLSARASPSVQQSALAEASPVAAPASQTANEDLAARASRSAVQTALADASVDDVDDFDDISSRIASRVTTAAVAQNEEAAAEEVAVALAARVTMRASAAEVGGVEGADEGEEDEPAPLAVASKDGPDKQFGVRRGLKAAGVAACATGALAASCGRVDRGGGQTGISPASGAAVGDQPADGRGEEGRADEREEEKWSSACDDVGSAGGEAASRSRDKAGQSRSRQKGRKGRGAKAAEASAASQEMDAAASSDTGLPAGWKEKVDKKGRVYYACRESGKTQWERPGGSAAAAASPTVGSSATAASAASQRMGAAASSDTGLPAGWKEKVDQKGRVYYACKQTGKAQWNPPAMVTGCSQPV